MTLVVIIAAYVVGSKYGTDAGWATFMVLVAISAITNDAASKITKQRSA